MKDQNDRDERQASMKFYPPKELCGYFNLNAMLRQGFEEGYKAALKAERARDRETSEPQGREFWIADIYESAMGVFNTKKEALENAWQNDEENVRCVREVPKPQPPASEAILRSQDSREMMRQLAESEPSADDTEFDKAFNAYVKEEGNLEGSPTNFEALLGSWCRDYGKRESAAELAFERKHRDIAQNNLVQLCKRNHELEAQLAQVKSDLRRTREILSERDEAIQKRYERIKDLEAQLAESKGK